LTEVIEEAKRILEALVVDDDAPECPDCGQSGCGWDRYDRLEKLAAEVVPELIAEVERLHSWDGVMSLLDEHYPADIFGAAVADDPARDPGPRIISLMRRINEIRELT
jgi:hypothetical protein